MPTPKWKLVVDIGLQAKAESARPSPTTAGQVDNRANELLLLIRTYTPADKTSPLAVYLPGFTSLRLLLEKGAKTAREEDLAHTLTESYSSYCRAGRNPPDIAWLLARDYMVLAQHHAQQPQQLHAPQQTLAQQHLQAPAPPQQQPSPLQTSFSTSISSIGVANSAAARQYALNTATAPSAQQQPFTNAQSAAQQAAQQQVVQLQTFDFPQQLPGQPSA